MADVTFTDPAVDDLRRLGPDVAPKVLRKVLILLKSPEAGYTLGGELTGYRKLVVGPSTWRIVYKVIDENRIEICEIWAVGPRADDEVYLEAAARVKAAAGQRPETRKLADVIAGLGKLSGGVTVPATPVREPVPDWLRDRLIYTVGMAPHEVAALSLEEGVDLWGEYMSKPRD